MALTDVKQAGLDDESVNESKLQISNAGTNGQYLQKQSGNTGGLTWATVDTSTLMPLAGGTFTGDVTFDNQSNAGRDIVWDESDDALEFKDNTAAVFGDGNDLYIWHNGTENFIEGPQHLIVKTTNAAKKIYLQSDAGIDISDVGVNEYQAKFINDGAVELYYDGTKRFETNTNGAEVFGQLVIGDGGNNTGDDNITFGSDNDCHFYHNGSHMWIVNNTGNIDIRAKAGEKSIMAVPDGAVELYYDNSKHLATSSTGGTLDGVWDINNGLKFYDTIEAKFGTGDDLKIWHDGSNSYIKNSTNALTIQGGAVYINDVANGKTSAGFDTDGGASLYYDNTKMFETKSTGPHILGISSGSGYSDIRYQTSDGRLFYDSSTRLVKTDIVDSPYGISALKQLKPRKYKRTDIEGTPNEIGFIADEVLSVVPEIVPFGPKSVYTKNDEDTEQIPINVDYRKMTVILTKALQEAITKIETLETKVAALEAA